MSARSRITVSLAVSLTVALAVALMCGGVLAQESRPTVRHRKVAVEDQLPELTEAEAALERKDYAAAEPWLRQAAVKEPSNYQVWFDLGVVYNATGKNQESIAAYRKSVEANPEVFESNLNLGLMLARSGSPEAEKFLRAATTLQPTAQVDEGRERAWLSLGHILAEKDPKAAGEAFQKASEVQPKDAEPHLSAGLLLERQKDFVGAEREYKQVLALAPQSQEAVMGLANIYLQSKQLGEAEEMLGKLTAGNSGDAALHVQLGRVFAAEGKSELAIAEFEAALKITPQDATAQQAAAELYVSAGKYEQAEVQYRGMAATNPKDGDVRYALGRVLMKQKKFPEAQQELIAVVQAKPGLGPAYGDLATVANENKNYALAIKALDMRDKLMGPIPIGYFLRATAYDHLRAIKPAIENYHLFLEAGKGQYPDQEWQARHRLVALEPKK